LTKKIAVVPCDGAGKEVVPEAVKVLRAAGADFAFEDFKVDADEYMRTGVPIPDATWKQLEAADSILFGSVGDARVADPSYLAGVLLRMRFELDLYVNLRPAKLYDERLSPLRHEDRRKVDLLIVRETEACTSRCGRLRRARHRGGDPGDINTYQGVTEYASAWRSARS
jgi:3-isopropylmalate dehydrogenase